MVLSAAEQAVLRRLWALGCLFRSEVDVNELIPLTRLIEISFVRFREIPSEGWVVEPTWIRRGRSAA
jgi:hypothetical protein